MRRTQRLFIAANIPEETKKSLFSMQEDIKGISERASFTKAENLHCTLCFIGEVDVREAGLVRAAIQSLQVHHEENYLLSSLCVKRIRRRGGDLFYLQLEASNAMHSIVQDIRRMLLSLQISFDQKEWNPHITLSRRTIMKKGTPKDAIFVPTLEFKVPEVVLYLSTFTSGGMRYTPLERIIL